MFEIHIGDANQIIDALPSSSVNCVYTSPNPPLSLQQKTELLTILNKCKRVLTEDGVLWLELGDYFPPDHTSFMIIPEAMVLLMRSNGWLLRSRVYWHRTEHLRQIDRNRFRYDLEWLFMFTKIKEHYFNNTLGLHDTSIIECPMENRKPGEFKSGYPEKIIDICLRTTTKPHDTVLDPFAGTGTTGVVALKLGRNFIGIENQQDNKILLETRLRKFDK